VAANSVEPIANTPARMTAALTGVWDVMIPSSSAARFLPT
jgi:hypothetical protein